MSQGSKIKMHGGKPMLATDYKPTARDEAIEEKYRSAAFMHVRLEGHDPEEVVQVRHPKLPNALMNVRRWQLAAHNLQPFDLKLIALMSTQSDRIGKPANAPIPPGPPPAGEASP